MTRTQRPILRRAFLAAALFAGAPLLTGCAVFPLVGRTTTGSLLPDERVAAIKARQTTRLEVLEWLGPPLAIARQDGSVLPVPDVEFCRSGGVATPAASFFEKFPTGDVAPDDVVYFYREHQVRTRSSAAVVIVGNKGGVTRGRYARDHRDDRLWILVDGATWVVKAHVLERSGPPRERPDPGEAEAPETTAGGTP